MSINVFAQQPTSTLEVFLNEDAVNALNSYESDIDFEINKYAIMQYGYDDDVLEMAIYFAPILPSDPYQNGVDRWCVDYEMDMYGKKYAKLNPETWMTTSITSRGNHDNPAIYTEGIDQLSDPYYEVLDISSLLDENGLIDIDLYEPPIEAPDFTFNTYLDLAVLKLSDIDERWTTYNMAVFEGTSAVTENKILNIVDEPIFTETETKIITKDEHGFDKYKDYYVLILVINDTDSVEIEYQYASAYRDEGATAVFNEDGTTDDFWFKPYDDHYVVSPYFLSWIDVDVEVVGLPPEEEIMTGLYQKQTDNYPILEADTIYNTDFDFIDGHEYEVSIYDTYGVLIYNRKFTYDAGMNLSFTPNDGYVPTDQWPEMAEASAEEMATSLKDVAENLYESASEGIAVYSGIYEALPNPFKAFIILIVTTATTIFGLMVAWTVIAFIRGA